MDAQIIVPAHAKGALPVFLRGPVTRDRLHLCCMPSCMVHRTDEPLSCLRNTSTPGAAVEVGPRFCTRCTGPCSSVSGSRNACCGHDGDGEQVVGEGAGVEVEREVSPPRAPSTSTCRRWEHESWSASSTARGELSRTPTWRWARRSSRSPRRHEPGTPMHRPRSAVHPSSFSKWAAQARSATSPVLAPRPRRHLGVRARAAS